MIKLFFIFYLSISISIAKESIDKKIQSTSLAISTSKTSYTKLNRIMAQNAQSILDQRKEINKQESSLRELKIMLLSKEEEYQANKSKLVDLLEYNTNLDKNQNKIEEELVFVIAQSVSLFVILENDYSVDEDSLMEFEILKHILKNSKEKVNSLNVRYTANAEDIEKLRIKTKYLKQSIDDIDLKRKTLIQTQYENKKSLSKLQIDKNSYKRELKILLEKQDTLKKTLSKLNLIQIDEIRKKKEEEERKLAFAKQKELDSQVFDDMAMTENADLPKVKKHGSSYQAIKTKKYTGPKTIAPLDSYTIYKKYGTYIDPIYGIKIFNESISLKPKKQNAKVKTVFNGKVIYADKTAVLNNIVIVEHDNGLHTIYANLSQISPNIKKGKKIKKGYSIGRVNDELIFEVTQKSYHINPIRLFQ